MRGHTHYSDYTVLDAGNTRGRETLERELRSSRATEDDSRALVITATNNDMFVRVAGVARWAALANHACLLSLSAHERREADDSFDQHSVIGLTSAVVAQVVGAISSARVAIEDFRSNYRMLDSDPH